MSLGHIKLLSVVDSMTPGSVEVHFIFYTLPERSYVFLNLLIQDRLLLAFFVA